MPLFGRVAELVVGKSGGNGILIKDLRVSFGIEKTASETLNNSKISIYNLNPDNRKLVETPNNAVILKAGYSEDIGAITIFVGIIRRSLTIREGVDWVTELELDDGLIAYRDSKFSLTFPPGAKGSDVIAGVAKEFDLPVLPIPADIASKTYPNGFSFVGRSRDAMGKVCQYLGAEWSIQNQQIQVLKKGGVAKRTAILLSPETGLIGSPALEAKTLSDKAAAKQGITTNSSGVIKRNTEKNGDIKERLEIQGYKCKSLLQPTILPGDLVKLKSEGIDNFFKVEKVVHSGDNFGADWHSELSLRFV